MSHEELRKTEYAASKQESSAEKCARTKRGVFFIVLSALFFALMGLFVRLSGDLPVFQKCFFRNSVAVLVAFALLCKSGSFRLQKGSIPALAVRSVAGTVGIICNFYAIDHLTISDASILNKLAPFFTILFSALFLREKAGWKNWLLIAAAFFGALFVVKPSFDINAFAPALIGVLGGLGAGLAYTCIHYLGGRGERASVIVFYFSLFSCLAVLPMTIIDFTPMRFMQVLYLLLAGVCASAAQFAITKAYTFAPAKDISVFDYSQVLFSALLGMIVLSEFPDWLSVVGYAIIIGAAVVKYLLARHEYKKSVKK